MRESLRRALRGERGVYLQLFILLVGVAVGVFAWMSVSGCGPGCGGVAVGPPTSSSWSTGLIDAPVSPVRAVLMGVRAQGRSGEQMYRTLTCEGALPGVKASFTYYPPAGAWGFVFSDPPDSVTEQYYQWTDLSPTTAIHISFFLPFLYPWSRLPDRACESFTVRTSDGGVSAVMHVTEVWVRASQEEPASEALRTPDPPAASDETHRVWQVIRWLDFPTETMDTARCTDWFNLLRSDKAFLALRVPIAPSEVPTQALQIPLLLAGDFAPFGDFAPILQIWRYVPGTTVYSTTLELRPDRSTFLANVLPQAEGEYWLALGVPPDAPACPPGLNVAAKNWSLGARIFLDLSDQPNNCQGCTLPLYYCYEGQDEPLSPQVAALTSALAGDGVSTYAEQGITCMGPQSTQLITSLVWKLGGASTDIVTATQPITFHHYIVNRSGNPLSFNLSPDSDLDVAWHFYGGSSEAPDLEQPITPPMPVANQEFKHFWLISDPLPADTAHGPYVLRLTAAPVSVLTDTQWTGDTIWVGDWVAPLPPLTVHHLYLPVGLRDQ
ncbi:MAG: hypothetical protein ACUVXG_01910 [Anaerolineae bacterium]